MKLFTLFTFFTAILSAGALPSPSEDEVTVNEFGGASALRTASTNNIGIAKVEEVSGFDTRDEAAVKEFLQKRQNNKHYGIFGCSLRNGGGTCVYAWCPVGSFPFLPSFLTPLPSFLGWAG